MRPVRLILAVAAVTLPGCGGDAPKRDEQHGKPVTTGTHTGAPETAVEP